MTIPASHFDPALRLAAEAALNSLWQGAALAALIWVLLRLLPRANAATRYGVWLATLLAVLCLPPLNALASLNSYEKENLETSDGRAHAEAPAPDNSADLARYDESTDAGARAATLAPERTTDAEASGARGAVGNPAESVERSGTARGKFGLRLGGGRWLQLVSVLWALLAAAALARLARSYLALRRLRRASRPLAEGYQRRLDHWLTACRITRRVSLRGSRESALMLMAGLRSAVVLFPERLACELTDDEFDQLLLHELAHARRRDDWTNLLQKLAEALFFFHPAVLWIGRRLDAERELACDEWAVSVTGAPRSYASCLVKLFELTAAHRSPLLATGALKARGQLSRRIETLLAGGGSFAPRLSAVGLLIPLGLLLAALIQLGRAPLLIAIAEQSDTPVVAEREDEAAPAARRPGDDTPDLPGGEVARESPREISGGDHFILHSTPEESLTPAPPTGGAALQGASVVDAKATQGTTPDAATHASSESPVGGAQFAVSPVVTPPPAENFQAPQTANEFSARQPSARAASPADLSDLSAGGGSPAEQRERLLALLKLDGLSRDNLIRILRAAKGINADGEKAEFLETGARFCTNDAAVLSAFFDTVASIRAPGEQQRALYALLKLKGRDDAILVRTLRAASAITSDGDKAWLLERAAASYQLGGAVLSAYLEVVASIKSSGERRRALTAAVRKGRLGDEGLGRVVSFARNISSDGEKAEFLERVAEVAPVGGAVRSAYLATVATINSPGEQRRALDALLKRKG